MRSLILAAALAIGAPAAAADVTVAKTQEADGSHTLVHEVTLDAPPADVWAAISTADGWKTWAAPTAWTPEGEADVIETSYSADAKPNGPSTIRQQVLARFPSRLLVFRTVKAPAGFPDFDTYAKVTSAFLIEPAGEGKTRLRLIAAGYSDTAAGRRLLGFFEKGNATSLEWLRARFRDGPKDWSKR